MNVTERDYESDNVTLGIVTYLLDLVYREHAVQVVEYISEYYV